MGLLELNISDIFNFIFYTFRDWISEYNIYVDPPGKSRFPDAILEIQSEVNLNIF